MISAVKTLIPNLFSVLYLIGLILCGLGSGWLLRKCFSILALRLQRMTGNTKIPLRKILLGTFFEALGKTSIFACFGIALIVFVKYAGTFEELSPEAAESLGRLFRCFGICVLVVFLWNLIRMPLALIRRYTSPANKSTATLLPLLSALLKICILAIGILVIIRIATDTQPTEILAMLGIGGLAIGLASQDTVKNFFGSVMLILDRPFQVGDTIDIGSEQTGTVEEVGVRSTRIRSRDGSVLSIPNGDLANRTIRTVTARETIRDEITLGLSYSSTPEQIEHAVALVHKRLADPRCVQHGGNAPRVYFGNFKSSSLDITAIYHFASSDYGKFIRFKHELNLAILRDFNAAGLEFAFPTQTIHLKQNEAMQS